MSDPNEGTRRRQMTLVVVGVSGILTLMAAGLFLFDQGATAKTPKPKVVSITAPGTVDDKDAWRAQQTAREKSNETLIQEVKAQLKEQSDKNTRLAKELEELRSRREAPPSIARSSPVDTAILSQPLPPPQGGLAGRQVLGPPNPGLHAAATQLNPAPMPPAAPPARELEIITFAPGGGPPSSPVTPAAPATNTPEVLGFPTDEKARQYGRSSRNTAVEFLPAGSFVRVAMLNGVDAPTGGQAQSNPLPVAFHVLDTANLASKHRLDIKDCRFVAAAWGDLSSERMIGRTETLTCIINGETLEMPVKGQVIGEDGKAGVRGRLVTKQGQLLANALFSGTLGGIGRAIQQASVTTTAGAAGITQTIDPDRVAQVGLGGGLSSAANMLAQYYLKAADKLFPVIETDGGRTVEILITKGAVYRGKAMAQDDYRCLLKRSGATQRSTHDD